MPKIMHIFLSTLNIGAICCFYVYGNKVEVSGTVDLLTIILTAVAILVTVLGVIVAAVGVFGFKFLQDRSTEEAKKIAEVTINRAMLEFERKFTEQINDKFEMLKSEKIQNFDRGLNELQSGEEDE